MERKYDTTFIIDGDINQLDREAIIKRFADDLEKNNASIERIVRWGMRTLAYEINKKSRGYYVIFYYTAEPAIIKTVERDLRINENVLRYMTVKFEGEHPSYITDEGEPDLKGQRIPEVVIDETLDESTDDYEETEDITDVESDDEYDVDADSEDTLEDSMDEVIADDEMIDDTVGVDDDIDAGEADDDEKEVN